jgi:hypothetical protein
MMVYYPAIGLDVHGPPVKLALSHHIAPLIGIWSQCAMLRPCKDGMFGFA